MYFVFLIFSFLFGAVVGSFLNVCIYRIPLGISIAYPPSRCPGCGASIPFYLNIPVIGYLVIRGRCASCKVSISPLYPAGDVSTGLFAVALFLRFGVSAGLFVYFALISALIVISF